MVTQRLKFTLKNEVGVKIIIVMLRFHFPPLLFLWSCLPQDLFHPSNTFSLLPGIDPVGRPLTVQGNLLTGISIKGRGSLNQECKQTQSHNCRGLKRINFNAYSLFLLEFSPIIPVVLIMHPCLMDNDKVQWLYILTCLSQQNL